MTGIAAGEVGLNNMVELGVLFAKLNLAIAYGYFETLFHLKDTSKIAEEINRLKGLNSLLDAAGNQEFLYDMFVESTTDLLEVTSEAILQGKSDETFLVDAFNTDSISNSVITHFKVSDC